MSMSGWFVVKTTNKTEESIINFLIKQHKFPDEDKIKSCENVFYLNFDMRQYRLTKLQSEYDIISVTEAIARFEQLGKVIFVDINKQYRAEVTKKEIKVGCQTFTHEKLKELYEASCKVTGESE